MAVLAWIPPDGFLKQAVIALGLPLWLLGVWRGAVELMRREPVLSIGSRGILDRRIAPVWVPWPAIRAVSVATIDNQSSVMLELEETADRQLPVTTWARRLAAVNAGIGYPGYAIASVTLVGGFPAVLDAIRAEMTRQGRTDIP